MKQWEIFSFPYPSAEQPHPFVILSPAPLINSPDYITVNALMRVSVRGDYRIKFQDVRLDESDGLDGPTVVRCHYVHALAKDRFSSRRGIVIRERRLQIARKIGDCLAFGDI